MSRKELDPIKKIIADELRFNKNIISEDDAMRMVADEIMRGTYKNESEIIEMLLDEGYGPIYTNAILSIILSIRDMAHLPDKE